MTEPENLRSSLKLRFKTLPGLRNKVNLEGITESRIPLKEGVDKEFAEHIRYQIYCESSYHGYNALINYNGKLVSKL